MIYKIPPASSLKDTQFVEVQGPNGIISGFQYDLETKTLWAKESQIIIPSFHGITHIAQDPVPDATVDTPGLMSADDKAKLESLLQMRLGVLGFQGAGFPDDGGWLQGDIILSAGSELISLERIGNVVRFTVDSPIPLSCGCEACAQIYWIQDETDVKAIRPPTCAGVLPDVNMYGEMAVYLFPENVVVDPNHVADTLKHKDDYPALIFKRYADSTTPSLGRLEMVLRRGNGGVTIAGHSMTPGDPAQNRFAEVVWFTGQDKDGNRIRFDLQSTLEPGLFGALLYKGHTLTRKMAVIVDYQPTVLTNNQYVTRYWDILSEKPVGDKFTSTNIWKYNNPENEFTTPGAPKSLALDGYSQVLPIGTLVQLWEMQISSTVVRRYFNYEPNLTAAVIWAPSAAVRFGDPLTVTSDTDTVTGGATTDIRLLEKGEWGSTWYEDPIYYMDGETVVGPIGNQFMADIDYNLPGLRVIDVGMTEPLFSMPSFLWHRQNYKNAYIKMLIGQPESSDFPPIDILLRAPIDSYSDVLMKVHSYGGASFGQPHVTVKGVTWDQLPRTGTLQLLTTILGSHATPSTWKYIAKVYHPDGIILMGEEEFPITTVTDTDMVIAALVHEDYNAPCLRLTFNVNMDSEVVQLQFKCGVLDMNTAWELSKTGVNDELVHDFEEGTWTVSKWYEQQGFIRKDENPTSIPPEFRCYMGGFLTAPIGDIKERWNTLEIMQRDDQLWVWWNSLIIPPSTPDSPIPVNTPYYPLATAVDLGKFGLRLWPGTKLRTTEVCLQNVFANEFIYGQLQITA